GEGAAKRVVPLTQGTWRACPRSPPSIFLGAYKERFKNVEVIRHADDRDACLKSSAKVFSGLLAVQRNWSGASFEAVRLWRYRPTFLAGEPVGVDTKIDVNFSLNNSRRVNRGRTRLRPALSPPSLRRLATNPEYSLSRTAKCLPAPHALPSRGSQHRSFQ